MKTKQEVINKILKSGAKYVKTSISIEPCSVSIAVNDIENADDCMITNDFYWTECAIGLGDGDY